MSIVARVGLAVFALFALSGQSWFFGDSLLGKWTGSLVGFAGKKQIQLDFLKGGDLVFCDPDVCQRMTWKRLDGNKIVVGVGRIELVCESSISGNVLTFGKTCAGLSDSTWTRSR